MKLQVYLNAYGNRRFVGVLQEERGRIFFEYAPEFIAEGIPLSPFMLPLKPGVQEDGKRTFDGLFGVFNDSLPDGWGCLLLDRKLRQRGLTYAQITPLTRLSLIGRSPMGHWNMNRRTSTSFPPVISNWIPYPEKSARF